MPDSNRPETNSFRNPPIPGSPQGGGPDGTTLRRVDRPQKSLPGPHKPRLAIPRDALERLLLLLEDPHIRLSEIAKVVQTFPGWEDRLRLQANLARRLWQRPIDHLERALAFLGLRALRAMVDEELEATPQVLSSMTLQGRQIERGDHREIA